MNSSKNCPLWLVVVRLSAFLIFGYSVLYQELNNTIPDAFRHRPFGKFIYLTYWDLLIQFSFFSLLTLVTLSKQKNFLNQLVDFLFHSLALPMALVVSSTFWIIYSIDRDLIFPKLLERWYPIWLNHTTHTLPGVMVLIELFWAKHKLPSMLSGFLFMNFIVVVYLTWLLHLKFSYDFWVYPILEVLNWPSRIVFFAGVILMNWFFFYLGFWVKKSQPTHKSMKLKK